MSELEVIHSPPLLLLLTQEHTIGADTHIHTGARRMHFPWNAVLVRSHGKVGLKVYAAIIH